MKQPQQYYQICTRRLRPGGRREGSERCRSNATAHYCCIHPQTSCQSEAPGHKHSLRHRNSQVQTRTRDTKIQTLMPLNTTLTSETDTCVHAKKGHGATSMRLHFLTWLSCTARLRAGPERCLFSETSGVSREYHTLARVHACSSTARYSVHNRDERARI